ncbi:hypothetical protein V6N13_048877 [Hibiscus sabdariffa]
MVSSWRKRAFLLFDFSTSCLGFGYLRFSGHPYCAVMVLTYRWEEDYCLCALFLRVDFLFNVGYSVASLSWFFSIAFIKIEEKDSDLKIVGCCFSTADDSLEGSDCGFYERCNDNFATLSPVVGLSLLMVSIISFCPRVMAFIVIPSGYYQGQCPDLYLDLSKL